MPMESCMRTCDCCSAGKMSMIRSIVWAVDWGGSVAKTRGPGSAAVRAVAIVSRSRISPARITSGSAGLAGERLEHGGQAELLELRNRMRDSAEGRADRASLEEAVDTEAGDTRDGICEIELLAGLETLALIVVQQAVDSVSGLLGGEGSVALQGDDPTA